MMTSIPSVPSRRKQVLGRVALLLAFSAALHLAGGCEKKPDDRICGLQPPYDSANYERWHKRLAAAGCFDEALDKNGLNGRQRNLAQ